MNSSQQRYLLGWVCLIALVLIIIIGGWRLLSGRENLVNILSDAGISPSHQMEGKQEDIQIKPTFADSESGTIMSGTDFTPSTLMSPWFQAYTGDMKNHYLLDDGAGGNTGLHFNKCSKSCCGEQYPLPFKMPVDSEVCKSKDEFVPSNYTCNNAWQDTGCVCLTKDQANFIGSRGGNA
jgi:hypothetical protein